MRVVELDIHRSFAQAAIFEDGRVIQEARVELVRERFLKFARSLRNDDEIVVETTGNSAAIERLLWPYVGRVVVANPRLVKAIAWARVKSDKVDAVTLAKLHAGGLLPEVWVADDTTVARRRQIAERMGVLAQLVRTKGRIQATLHANLIPRYTKAISSVLTAGGGWRHCRWRTTSAACSPDTSTNLSECPGSSPNSTRLWLSNLSMTREPAG